jgi:hypothetical protein
MDRVQIIDHAGIAEGSESVPTLLAMLQGFR